MPSFTTWPGPMNETATQAAATRRAPPCSERRRPAGAKGAWRWGAPVRIRCMGNTRRTMNKMMEGTDWVSPCTGVEAQIPVLGTYPSA